VDQLGRGAGDLFLFRNESGDAGGSTSLVCYPARHVLREIVALRPRSSGCGEGAGLMGGVRSAGGASGPDCAWKRRHRWWNGRLCTPEVYSFCTCWGL